MKEFEFDSETLSNLSTDSKRLVLEQQAEEFRSIRNQAAQIVRLFVASAALLIAFAQTSLSDIVGTLFSNSPQFLMPPTLSSGAPDPVVLGIIAQTRLVGVSFITISGGFFFISAIMSVRVLRQPNLLPSSYRKNATGGTEGEVLDSWIQENDQRLTNIRRMSGNTLAQIDYTFMFLSLGILSILSVYIGMPEFIIMVNVAALVSVPGINLLYIARSIQNVDTDALLSKHHFKKVINEFFRLWNMKGPGVLAMTLLILFYGNYSDDAWRAIEIWI